MNDDRVQRRLAAILAADVVGYSKLMESDEVGTLALFNTIRADVLDPAIETCRGRIFKTTGDGFLAEFASAVDAVQCAVRVQEAMAKRELVFRIGVNLGDIIIEGEDVFGDGVNVAARLEGLAPPGGVLFSDSVHAQVAGKAGIDFTDAGEATLKNIDRPVAVWRWGGDGMPESPAPVAAPARPDKPSIAVLPFANRGADAEQAFFSDGIAEDIVTALSRLNGFFVISYNTTVAFRGSAKDARAIAGDLGVRYVLEGSVRTAGPRVRITAQLTDADGGQQLWAERYDRALDDVFAIQDEITESVVGCIEPELYAAEHERLKRKPPQNLDAWESFVRGMFLYSQHSQDGTRDALDMLARAVALDGDYAQAHGLMAVTLVWRSYQGWEDREDAFARATSAANRAVQCDPREPWAYIARGFMEFATRRNAETVAAFQRAVDCSPNFAYAHGLLGAAHAMGGRPDEAIACIDHGVRLSPRDIFGEEYHLYYAFTHFQAGRYAEAAAAAEFAIQQRPGHPVLYIMGASAHAHAGDDVRAEALAAELTRLVPDIAASGIERDFFYVSAEDRTRLADGLRRAGLG